MKKIVTLKRIGAPDCVIIGLIVQQSPDLGQVSNAVPFVLSFSFLSGFAYVLAGVGIEKCRPWAGPLAIALALAVLAVSSLLGVYILRGGAFEARMVGAMILRTAIWIGIAGDLWRATMPGSPRA